MDALKDTSTALLELNAFLAFASVEAQGSPCIADVVRQVEQIQGPLREAFQCLLAQCRAMENKPAGLQRLIDRHDLRALLVTVSEPRGDAAQLELFRAVREWIVLRDCPPVGMRERWHELVEHLNVVSALCSGASVKTADLEWIEYGITSNITKTGYVLINNGTISWLGQLHALGPAGK